MSTLELLQLQNEHKDNFFEKGEDNQVMSNEYVIHEDDDFEPGDGQKVYIKDGYVTFESTAEGGYVEFKWKCDIESFKMHIAKYEQVSISINNIDYEKRCEQLEKRCEQLLDTINNMSKTHYVILECDEKDEMKRIKEFLRTCKNK